MKRTGNKNLKIAAATMMTIFSLFTCFSGAMAWFIGMRDFNDEMENFEVKSTHGLLESITFHKLANNGKTIDIINGIPTPTHYSFSKASVGTITYDWESNTQRMTGNTSIQLDPYEPIDPEQPLLLLLNFYEENLVDAGSIKISAESAVNQFLGKRENSLPVCSLSGEKYDSPSEENRNIMIRDIKQRVDEDGKAVVDGEGNPVYDYYFPLSSAVRFQYAELRGTRSGESDPEDPDPNRLSIDDITNENTNTYDFTMVYGNSTPSDLKDGINFVSVNSEAETSDFDPDIDLFTSTAGYLKHVALVLDYYPDAIEFIYSTFLGNDILEEDFEGILHFICDWTMVI